MRMRSPKLLRCAQNLANRRSADLLTAIVRRRTDQVQNVCTDRKVPFCLFYIETKRYFCSLNCVCYVQRLCYLRKVALNATFCKLIRVLLFYRHHLRQEDVVFVGLLVILND